MTLSDLDTAPLLTVATLAGVTPKPAQTKQGGLYVSPCPICARTSAHTRSKSGVDPRGPVHIRGGWKCQGCGAHGSRADLIALTRWGVRWSQASAEQRADVLDQPAPAPVQLPPPLPYLDAAAWEALVGISVPAGQDEACLRWADRRRLPLAPDLLAIVGDPVEGMPLWTVPRDDRPARWLPDLGARLLCPLSDHHGVIRGARLRSVRPDPVIKEQAIRGHSAQGLVYAPWSVRERWQAGEPYPGPCALLEGKPDQLAAWGAWGREVACLGFLEGSFAKGAPWLEGLSGDVAMVYQEDAPDKDGRRKGRTFFDRAAAMKPGLRGVGVSAVWRAAGEAWVEGRDLADLAGRVPSWGF